MDDLERSLLASEDTNGVSDAECRALLSRPLPRGAPNPNRDVFAYMRWLEGEIEESKRPLSVRH